MLIYIFLLIRLVTNNLWDNLYSNLRSPQYELYPEFMVHLYNGEEEVIRISCSMIHNCLKISLLDDMLIKNFTIVDLYVNFTNATASFDFDDKCLYKALPGINLVNVDFLLHAYDLFTFFRKVDEKNVYEYILTNPNGSGFNLANNPLVALLKDIDKDALAVFRVDMDWENLVDVDFKFNGYELTDLLTKVIPVELFKPEDFTPKHECKLYEDKFQY
jgi:hypothetical protein